MQYKLSQLVQIISNTFSEIFVEEFLFTAEITKSNIINNRIYLELIEFDNNGKTLAKSRAIIYDINIYRDFLEISKLTNLMEIKWLNVLFTGKVSFHQEYGFSISISKIHAEYIQWQLKQKENNIIDQLTKEWIINQNKALWLWFPPIKIAVISSQNSQWFEDFRAILDHSNYKFEYSLYPTSIHGNQAIDSVYNSLKEAYMDIKNGTKYSLVAIIRGGGGSSGIIRQNDINIARWVCHMQIPVLLAVGHTSDQYVLDKIVRYPMKTPSDAAHFMIDYMDNLTQEIWYIYNNITNIISQKKQTYIYQIDNIYSQIKTLILLQKSQIINNINMYYISIKSIDMKFLLDRWFAIIKKWDRYINKDLIQELWIGDKLDLYIYDQKLKVEIIDD